METPKPTIDLSPTASLLNGSPKSMYVFFLLSLAKNYFESAVSGQSGAIENATAALIAFCPNKPKRTELWGLYVKARDDPDNSGIAASVIAVGSLIDYLSEVLEWEEEAVGGVL
jgi:hypothetical protein